MFKLIPTRYSNVILNSIPLVSHWYHVKNHFCLGYSISVSAGGGNAEYVACREELLMALPKRTSFVEAAAIPEAWLTAHQLLFYCGRFSYSGHYTYTYFSGIHNFAELTLKQVR